MRVLIVGAGILGAHHALAAAIGGHTVTMLDRHAVPRGASSRNLGAIRVSGRAVGPALSLSRYGRTRWQAIAERVPGIGFDPSGSITLLRDESEVAVAEEYLTRYHDLMDLELIPGSRIDQHEPAITGAFAGALLCRDDAWIRPGVAMPALIEYLRTAEGVDVRLGTEVKALERRGSDLVASTTGNDVHADVAFVCTGDAIDNLFRDSLDTAPLRRRRIHAFEVAHHGRIPRSLVTDGSALRAYPGYRSMPSAHLLEPIDLVGVERIEWVAARSPERSVLVGETRRAEDWSGESMQSSAERWLVARTTEAFGAEVRDVRRRWSAGLVEVDPDRSHDQYLTLEPMPGVTLITGLGVMGNTLAPAIARSSIEALT